MTNRKDNTMKAHSRALAAVALSALVTLSACANTDPLARNASASDTQSARAAASGTITIAGAGASSQENAMNTWRANFQSAKPTIEITYDGVGSGAGVEQFLSGQVAFAGTDKALKPEEVEASKQVCNGSQAINMPVYISPIAVVFTLEGVKELKLSASTVAKIFNDQITTWNDPEITGQNPGVTLPSLPITTVHRADKSGTTENFTAYLAAAAPEAWPHKASKEWPVASGESGDKTAGLIQAVQAGNGTIGYADASQVGSLGAVALKVGDEYVPYSPEAAGKAVAGAKPAEGRADNDLALDLDYAAPAQGAYPLILVSYLVACPGYPSAEEAKVVSDFFGYIASADGQAAAAETAGAAPLPAEFADKVATAAASLAAK